jgi:hypothetical protein
MSEESSVEGDVQEGICHDSEIYGIWEEAGLGSSSSREENDKSSDMMMILLFLHWLWMSHITRARQHIELQESPG